jgi:hypothetical protein
MATRTERLVALGELAVLAESRGLVSLRTWRETTELGARFDAVVLELGKARQIDLHFHDLPGMLTEAERAAYVWDGAMCFCGAGMLAA